MTYSSYECMARLEDSQYLLSFHKFALIRQNVGNYSKYLLKLSRKFGESLEFKEIVKQIFEILAIVGFDFGHEL